MRAWLMPLVAAQAVRVRRTTPRLPEASGPDFGRVGARGAPPVRLGVLGESTAAGVGVDSHEQGIAGALARELSGGSGRPVEWVAVGENGATLSGIGRRLADRLVETLPADGAPLDVTVLLAGVNDVLTRRDPSRWRADLERLLRRLDDVSRQVVVAGVPPFGEFPSLPRALAAYLDERASALDAVSAEVCAAHDLATWLPSRGLVDDVGGFFAADGFHPSADGYRRWAAAMAPVVEI